MAGSKPRRKPDPAYTVVIGHPPAERFKAFVSEASARDFMALELRKLEGFVKRYANDAWDSLQDGIAACQTIEVGHELAVVVDVHTNARMFLRLDRIPVTCTRCLGKGEFKVALVTRTCDACGGRGVR